MTIHKTFLVILAATSLMLADCSATSLPNRQLASSGSSATAAPTIHQWGIFRDGT